MVGRGLRVGAGHMLGAQGYSHGPDHGRHILMDQKWPSFAWGPRLAKRYILRLICQGHCLFSG